MTESDDSPNDNNCSDILANLKSNKELLHEFSAEGNSELASVHVARYEAAMHYYKRVGPSKAFYEQALSYLQPRRIRHMHTNWRWISFSLP
jgi:hypothetical protein